MVGIRSIMMEIHDILLSEADALKKAMVRYVFEGVLAFTGE